MLVIFVEVAARPLFQSAAGICANMAKNFTSCLLEVTVGAFEPTLWKWQVSDSETELRYGYETTRETAQIQGDSALFELLSENLKN
jgi:hypothetical protein